MLVLPTIYAAASSAEREFIVPTPFGPRLIGETEKALNALLHRFLEGSGLTEPQWVVLRLADHLDGSTGVEGLVAAIVDRAHFADAASLVEGLTERGLLDRGRLTDSGRQHVDGVQATIAAATAPIWDDLPAADVAVATSVLNEVLVRARAVLA